jgi:hypothetical protein
MGMLGKEWIWMDKERRDCGVTEILHLYLPGDKRRIHENSQDTCLRAEIWTRNLQNTKQGC